MKLPTLIPLYITSLLASCSAQHTTKETYTTFTKPLPVTVAADTVTDLANNIMTIYQDKTNRYWFASWEDGLYTYDGKNLLHFTTKHGLPHDRVEEIREDDKGNVFFNTVGGLWKFDGTSLQTLVAKESNVWKLQPGDVWFKSHERGVRVYRYDGSVLHSLAFPETNIGETWLANNPGVSDPRSIYSMYKDSKGNIWFGTGMLGACRYNGESFDWIAEEDVTELHNGPSNGVRSIIEDKDGYFWFNSAFRYKVNDTAAQGQPFYRREKSIGNLDGSPDSDFWEYLSIARDTKDQLWIATYGNGVWRYDGKGTTYYPVRAGGTEDIHVFSIYKDNHGILWLGTHEHGAYRFNGKTFEKFKPGMTE